MSETTPLLELRGVSKSFGSVQALTDVDFEVRRGEVMALVGDNGAGKSTLIKLLSGALQPDEGEIRLDGELVHFRSPLDARRAGIETVYQDLAVAGERSCSANVSSCAMPMTIRAGIPRM